MLPKEERAVRDLTMGTGDWLVVQGVPEEEALEKAKEVLAIGSCTSGQQCAVAT